MTDDPPLFALPASAPRPVPAGVRPNKATAWTRYRSTTRLLCDDCTRLIHQRGIGNAPLPARARWRYRTPNGDIGFVCDDHRAHRRGEKR